MKPIDSPVHELAEADLEALIERHFSAPRRHIVKGDDMPLDPMREHDHNRADWLRKSRSVPPSPAPAPAVIPCRPVSRLTRLAMAVSAWFNRKT